MSEPTNRPITGLTPRPREFNVSGLTSPRNKPTTSEPTETPTEAETPKRPTPAQPTKQAPTAAPKVSVGVYLSEDVRDRARAAFRATGHLHGDESWSAFVEHAILTLTEAREAEHNGGAAYQPHRGRLAPGRPTA